MRFSVTSSRWLGLGAALWAAVAGAATVERRLGVMGTSLRLEVTADDRGAALEASEAAVLAIERAERRLSTWRGDTELARLNLTPVGVAMDLSEQTAAELREALACAEATGGAFDPTVGALVEAWDLRGPGRVPDARSLGSALGRVGYAKLEVVGGRAIRRADIRVEEGGFGKGAALDRAAEALGRSAARAAWVDLGGQVLVLGREAVVAIAHPEERDRAVLQLSLSGGSLSTTGNSERGRMVGGRRVGHVLDPRTGRPAAEIGSVTVLAETGALADCLSTALYVLGPEAALEWARKRPGVEVIVLERRGRDLRARASAGLRGLLSAVPGVPVRIELDGGEEMR